MVAMWWVLGSMAFAGAPESDAPTCPTSFAFHGQPECVELTYVDGRTTVANRCEKVLLVDQSVQGTFQPLMPGASTEVRDLSTFTLGLDGKLYRTVAAVQPCASAEATDHQVADDAGQQRQVAQQRTQPR